MYSIMFGLVSTHEAPFTHSKALAASKNLSCPVHARIASVEPNMDCLVGHGRIHCVEPKGIFQRSVGKHERDCDKTISTGTEWIAHLFASP
jgi:hypothetical protein